MSLNKRLIHIDMMIGIAMILVVLGHLSIGDEPEWYRHGLHNWIYTFHMRLFVFLSAFLIRYTYKDVHSLKNYGSYLWKKFKKFFLPFLFVGIAVILFTTSDITFSKFESLVLTFLRCPRCSEASFLWYIYLLFGFYIISPILFSLPQLARVILCIASMFLPMLSAGNDFCAFDYTQYTFFYFLGILCAEWIEDIRQLKSWTWVVLSVPFLVFSVWVFTEGVEIGFEFPQLEWWLLPVGVASLPLFYLLAQLFAKISWINKPLTLISRNCYWIYLLQMFVIWGCEKLFRIIFAEPPFPYAIFMVVTTLLALAIPIALVEFFSSITDKKSRATHEPPR